MKTDIKTDFWTCVLAALILLTLPLKWLLAAVLAAAFHELGHLTILYLLCVPVTEFRVGSFGAYIETGPLTRRQEMLCASAGPAASLCLLLLCRWLPRVAICGGVQGLYNLIPVYPMDGGRILKCALAAAFSQERTEAVCRVVELSFAALLLILLTAVAIVLRLGILPFLLGALLLSVRKIPCKLSKLRVQ